MDSKKRPRQNQGDDEHDEIDEKVPRVQFFEFVLHPICSFDKIKSQALEKLERLQRQRMMDMFGYDPEDDAEDRHPQIENTKNIQKDKKPQHGDSKHPAPHNTYAPSHGHAGRDPAQSKAAGQTVPKQKPMNKGLDMAPTKVCTAAILCTNVFVAEHR
jgi:hypothetical protein